MIRTIETGDVDPSFLANLAAVRNQFDPVEHRLSEAAQAFVMLTDPTPVDYTEYWKERLTALQTRVPRLKLRVPKCDRSHGQLQDLRGQYQQRGETMALVVHLREMTLPVLAQIHPPLVGHWSVSRDNGIESVLHYGWLDVEDSTQSPNLGKNEEQLEDIGRQTNRFGMTLPTYYIGSYDYHDRTAVL